MGHSRPTALAAGWRMSPTLSWTDLLLRLAVTLAAGAVIGANRGERGKPAGLRTTLLVCLAASLSMLLTNLLLGTAGKHADSFAQFDVMRLPLGILSGMGFIGGGAILRRGELIVGVTTAATLWFVTVVGLCIGAGSIGLGVVATGLGFVILSGLPFAERYIPQERRARLLVACDNGDQSIEQLTTRLQGAGFAIRNIELSFREGKVCEARLDLRWRAAANAETTTPGFLAEFAGYAGIRALHWNPDVR
jgi:putative Mg2+ transporter-C (MgtC) family protein